MKFFRFQCLGQPWEKSRFDDRDSFLKKQLRKDGEVQMVGKKKKGGKKR